MKNHFLVFYLIISNLLFSQEYGVKINLNNVVNDQVFIEITVPPLSGNKLEYHMPVVTPGTYSTANYGNLIEKIYAYDKDNKRVSFRRKNKNTWVTNEPEKIFKICYWIDDSYDKKITYIPRVSGSSFKKESQFFMLNFPCIFGYFKGYKNIPYKINVEKPASRHLSTSLKTISQDDKNDIFYASNYIEAADNPVMYHNGDTISHQFGKTRFHLAAYSDNGAVDIKELDYVVRRVDSVIYKTIGDQDVSDYFYLFYFDKDEGFLANMNYAALEHRKSSYYYMNIWDNDASYFLDGFTGLACHEFLHRITPLGFCSNKISDYDYQSTKMSKHLWLYEGFTEYLSVMTMFKTGLYNEKELRSDFSDKLSYAEKFGDYSIAKMSQKCLNINNLVQRLVRLNRYSDVYSRGAILGLLLDIEINKQSSGQKNLLGIIMEMKKKYDCLTCPFEEEKFIDEFTELSGLNLKPFFDKYILGSEPLPLEKSLSSIGWKYISKKKKYPCFVTGMKIERDSIYGNYVLMDFDKNTLGLEKGDIITAINGSPIQDWKYFSVLGFPWIADYISNEITLNVKRGNEKLQLKGKATLTIMTDKTYVTDNYIKNIYEGQLRKQVLGR
ncbi:MAG: hypothetical protein A2W91_04010 [Bacteroidetes bacterium GWF2_38_335]|nr:MAG: hypothetical protein A2W91_04010 [Bacteroidetes bacterium GWF2_38_335]OFY79115.1 MAG: hypothetical protein A2281_03345 [Bacteroidetes bacterium RIFOXYA12_FULL_38_20]HBS88798.1 hypothetical protein [Bacteroidales bacterium]